ncbi:phospholipid carrier-dependent glycosyltransferase [Streptomyces sp. NPDC048604]|uniref:phospholipid carrier-dependent glycosyltransferase n=1 Tax=Streptomyces sp. NPDC048604 TaxID=3365578 RepID=UPI00371780D2
MTALASRTASASASTIRRTVSRVPAVAVVAGAVFVLTAVLRLVNIGSSADIFTDEVLYRDIGHNTVVHGYPYEGGSPFFLHPPAFFYLMAGWEYAFGFEPNAIMSVYDMRVLNALLAAATAAALTVVVARASRSWQAAAAAGALFAVDAFCIRQNGRVLLETAMMLPAIAGFAVLLPLFWRPLPARARLRAVSAGLLFGMSVLTKDWAVFVTVLPVLMAMLMGWGPPRRLLLGVVGMSAVPYAVYVAVVAIGGELSWFLEVKSQGVQRLLGLVQETGFNSAEAPSVVSRLADEAPTYAATYLVLTACLIALVILLRWGNPAERLMGLLNLSGVCALAYAVLFGTLEEHYLYLLLVTSLISVTVAVPLVLRRRNGRTGRVVRRFAVTTLVVLLGISGTSYVVGRMEPDDGYAKLRAYLETRLPAGSSITVVDGTPYFASTGQGITSGLQDLYRVGKWVTPQARAEAGVRYVVVPWKEVREGYTFLTVGETRRLIADGDLVFSFKGRTYDTLALYRMPPPNPSVSPDSQTRTP